jgi:hypothetical protein
MPHHNSAEANAIFKCLMLLPHDSYRELDLTLDQRRWWFGNKVMTLGMALCWRALHTEEEVDLSCLPDEYHRQKVWLCTLYWQRHWEMIIACFPKLRQIAGWLNIPFPFAAPVELFTYILAQQVNGDFAVCLQRYAELSSPKAEKILKHTAKNLSFAELSKQYSTPAGRKKLEQMDKNLDAWLRQTGESNFWVRFSLLFSFILAQTSKNAFIESTVAAFRQAVADIAKLDATKRHTAPSITWHKGVKKYGKQGGAYE